MASRAAQTKASSQDSKDLGWISHSPNRNEKHVADVEVGAFDHASLPNPQLHRRLRSKEVQLFAIGGAIGTGLFVQMGSALPKGGPAGLFLGFVIWGAVMLCVNECFAEMVCYAPIPSPFIRLAGVWVDEALAFAMSWNFFLNMALLIPYEIVAFNILLGFWTDAVPVEAVIVVIMVVYALLNTISVRYFGVAEFYLSIFKVFLIFMCLSFTVVTMLGGNPLNDRYGFRYWKEPGAFVEHLVPGSTGKFLGVLSCIVQATFSITGPEYISMVAGETEAPRTVLPKAYRSFVFRMLGFFLASALALGIVIPYNDPTLLAVLSGKVGGSGTGAASPYVIAMDRLKISGLPHVVNALIMTSVLSCGNGIFFSASRTLYGMSLNGTAPRLFSKTMKSGVPIYAVLACLGFCCLAFLQVKSSSAQVLIWLVYLITACQLLNYFSVALTYRQFHAALRLQGVDRRTLPYRGKLQPYTSYVAMFGCGVMLLLLGYTLFIAGGWDTTTFFLDYTFLAAFPIAFGVWKLLRKTKFVRPGLVDLTVEGLVPEIDEHERSAGHEPRKE
ncbi:related to amino acid transporters [Ramularia collo-cygni]|uniref:Related to amino acid transporters n=1 Tax=Ramularia collo-cygni TaxID=112498 RepID=A0A2D3VJR1_9PEZI|nr:related to amino acid transporters [Ramularia collo-cygni]CZT25817.1 related to amino acid transporters [Ramularia collo-cygni]